MTSLFCEIYVRTLLPVIRAMIARELINTYGFTQWSAAKALGITQPLINYYLSGKRGSRYISYINTSEEVRNYVVNAAGLIAEGKVDLKSVLCDLCMRLRSNEALLNLLKDRGLPHSSKHECPR